MRCMGRGEDNNCGFDCILEDQSRRACRLLSDTPGYSQFGTLGAWRYELTPGVSWLEGDTGRRSLSFGPRDRNMQNVIG